MKNYPADIRKLAAEHCRDIRAMWPTLKGDWSRREWNNQCRLAAHGLMRRTEQFRRANV